MILVAVFFSIIPIFRIITYILKTIIKFINSCQNNEQNHKTSIGIFHPYCDGGGGGERVLWVFINALLKDVEYRNKIHIYLYSGEMLSKEKILLSVKNKFDIDMTSIEMMKSITIVPIYSRSLLEAKWYPFLTIFGQSIGGLIVGFECCLSTWLYPATQESYITPIPDVFIDTMGASFSYIAAKLCNCKVITYTHYPTISTDMLNKVREMKSSYNNNEIIAKSTSISTLKLIYYNIYAYLYGAVMNQLTDQIIVNSSWTENHIRHIVNGLYSDLESNINKNDTITNNTNNKILKIFPPCNTNILTKFKPIIQSKELKCENNKRLPIFLSIGQFRPEKEHSIQIQAFYKLLQNPVYKHNHNINLYLIGSVRNKDDQDIVNGLVTVIKGLHNKTENDLDFQSRIILCTNVKYDYIKEITHCGSIGLHSMYNEHFGISVVEMMAAGLITIANNSGGPQKDIITNPIPVSNINNIIIDTNVLELFNNYQYNGYLCQSIDEYADSMAHALDIVLNHADIHKYIQENAKKTVLSKFSDETFEKEMLNIIKQYI